MYNFVLLGWNGRDCVNGQKSTPRSRYPASENAAQQRCRGLSSVSQHVPEEDDIETDSCKASSPAVSSQLLKHSSIIVGAAPQNPKNTSSKVRTKFLAFHVKYDLTPNLCK